MSTLDKRLIYYVTDHNPRSLVERVDFRSGIGYLDGNGERARLGIGGGPELVVTNLAVLDFEPGSQRMRLKSVHAGVTVRSGPRGNRLRPGRPRARPRHRPRRPRSRSLSSEPASTPRLPQAPACANPEQGL